MKSILVPILLISTIQLVACLLTDHQLVTNDRDVVQFSVLNSRTLIAPNRERRHALRLPVEPELKFSLNGALIDQIDSINSTAWKLNLTDGSWAEISVEQQNSALVEYYFLWHGRENEKQTKDRSVCFHYGYGNASWYNSYQSYSPEWPMNTKLSRSTNPLNYLLDFNSDESKEEFYKILELFYLNTDGFSILLDQYSPLSIRREPNNGDPRMCFSVSDSAPYASAGNDSSYLNIGIRIFAGINIKTVTDYVVHSSGYIPKPKEVPDSSKFTAPSWSTYSLSSNSVNQSLVEKFVQNIEQNGLAVNGSEIAITDVWWPAEFNLNFETIYYQTVDSMVEKLKTKGFTVKTIIYPELHSTSQPAQRFYLKNAPDRVDFSLPEAALWYEAKLREFQIETRVQSFIADASHLKSFSAHAQPFQKNPNLLVTRYLESVARVAPSSETALAYKSQHLPLFVQLSNQRETSFAKLLESLIANVLSVSIGGYSWITPYPVGNYQNQNNSTLSEEYYIRWVQAIALLPSMAFGNFPWSYQTQTTLDITKKFIKLHSDYSQTIINLANQRVRDGSPIVRPMWYGAPNDPRSYRIHDQFMLGESVVVAPVLKLGQRERTVYLPEGRWKDQHLNQFAGPTEIKVKVPLEELAYFVAY